MKSGPHYWRSLDELAETPEFKDWVAREFPAGAGEMADPVSRRKFVKLMSASFLLAGLGLTGCRRPEERIFPAAKQDSAVPGIAQYYATAMPERESAIPLVVKSYEGRPVKVEGNKRCPDLMVALTRLLKLRFSGYMIPIALPVLLKMASQERASRLLNI